jgi:threonine dehydrogenase-like Zn-dependent dehydrogenase
VVQLPDHVGKGVRVKVRSAGICGSDLHLLSSSDLPDPMVTLGHEVAGVTENGTAVAIEPLAPCEACDPCLRGEYNLCVRSSEMILGLGLDGGMADEMIVPERSLVRLPSGVDPRDASLVEPMAVLIHSFRRRVIDSVQLTAKHKVATPVGWRQGEDVIVVPAVSDDDARAQHGSFEATLPYLRKVKQPSN